MKVSICSPSYKRADRLRTAEVYPSVRFYVDGSEYEEYTKKNPKLKIALCADGIQGNLCRVRNHILKTEFEQRGMDAVLLLDDDLKGIYYWENEEKNLLKDEELEDFVIKHSMLAKELGARFWGVLTNKDPQTFKENVPFSTVRYIGGPFQAFLKENECWYSEELAAKEDYDMTLQQLHKHRIVLRVNKFHYDCKQSNLSGGITQFRNVEREHQLNRLLIKKWGSSIVKLDYGRARNMRKGRKFKDYNPIIRVPIKGV